jgi:hypothetical protein
MKSSFKTWERKMLRKIYGPTEGQNGWRMRTNDELQVVYSKPNNVTTIKLIVVDDRTVKEVFLGNPGGRRNAGRPKLRWLGCTESDLKSMGVERWRKKPEDRFVRAIILKGAQVKL